MAGIKDLKMKPKLLSTYLIAGLIPLSIIAVLSLGKAKDGMMSLAFNQLESVQKIKQGQVQTFFGERLGDSQVLAANPYTRMAVAELNRASTGAREKGLSGSGLFQDSAFKSTYDAYHLTFKHYMETYGYYDVFLISPDAGDVFYTVTQEADFGTILSRENTHLAKVWKEALRTGQAVLSDMEPYAPSAGAPAMFVACPVVDGSEMIGVLALQIANDAINAIMQERAGMGQTGETYLVGSDKKMRSDSFLDPTGHSVLASFKGTVQANGVDTEAATNALAGRSDQKVITDYNGNPVLSAYSPLELPGGIRWATLAEIDLAEVEAPINAIRNSIIYIAIGIAVVVGLLAFWLATGIANPIIALTSLAQRIAKGDLNQNVTLQQGDEVGLLANAFREMGDALRTKADAAEQIAQGNLSVDLQAASQEDTLGNAMINMVGSLKGMNAEISGLVQTAVAGKLDTRGNADQFKGDYAQIIQGVNDTLDAVIEPINEASTVLDKVANRDLTARVIGDYQGDHARIKDALNLAAQNLDEGMLQVGGASEQVSSAAGQISSGSQSLAQGSSEQASSLEEISSSLEEIASMTRQNADNSNQAKSLAQTARESADSGTDAMGRMTKSIDSIKTSSDETAKIVSTIDEIAFQTNLLALNAAVEAARAGEAGKGFAVVAEEVRNLAMRSAEAAKNTASMIEESVKNAEAGVKVTEEVAQALNEIAEGTRKVNDLVGEIAAASTEQSQGIEQVNEGVTQLNQVTQQNAANAEESASAAEELNGQSEELQTMVSQFTLTASGTMRQRPALGKTPPVPALHSPAPAALQLNGGGGKTSNGNGNHASENDPEQLIPFDEEDEEVLKEF
ncbi:MAG: HAMP domain-containing protein [Gemmatimonadetes bacterium]|jgi:methyl-accepting chemotaxis protein|nr:HAMP domain-containing protein [Gemmatimonadota bacterium]